MKETFKNKGVATIEELLELCIDCGVKFIACQMTMDVFGFSRRISSTGLILRNCHVSRICADAEIQLFM